MIYKNLVKGFNEGCTIVIRHDIEGTEHPLDFFPIEYTRSWLVHFDPLELAGGHHYLEVKDGEKTIYQEKLYYAI